MIIKCPECGHQVSDQAKTCPSCGINIAGNVIRCQECGEMVFCNQQLCPNCHAMLAQQHVRPVIYNKVEEESGTDAGKQPPKKKNKTVIGVIVIALVVTLSVVFAGLYFYQNMLERNELEAYENAIMSDEPSVLQNYIDIYGEQAPQEHVDSVMTHLDRFRQMDKDWTDAKVSRNKAVIERYLKTHPGSVHETEAMLMVDSIDWVVATLADTQDSYRTYMDSHRDGQHYDEAVQQFEKKIEEQKQEEADTLDLKNSEL